MLRLAILFVVAATARTDWTPVTRGEVLQWDLFETPLEISVDSPAASGDKIALKLGNQNGDLAGIILIKLDSIPKYRLKKCMNSYQPLTNLPNAQQKIFRISKYNREGSSNKAVRIECNGVAIVDVLPSSDTCNKPDWETFWGRDVQKITFHSTDSASDDYRPQGDWTTVKLDHFFRWPVITNTRPLYYYHGSSHGLEILTDAMLGSDKEISVEMYEISETLGDINAGTIRIKFSNTPQYSFVECTDSYRPITEIGRSLANCLARVEKIIRITRFNRLGDIYIECDGVRFLNFAPSDDTCDNEDWRAYWWRLDNKIKFSQEDTASIGFRLLD